jgi:hypothetical protein
MSIRRAASLAAALGLLFALAPGDAAARGYYRGGGRVGVYVGPSPYYGPRPYGYGYWGPGYVVPPPIYYAPPPPVVYAPPPVYYAPPTAYYPPAIPGYAPPASQFTQPGYSMPSANDGGWKK